MSFTYDFAKINEKTPALDFNAAESYRQKQMDDPEFRQTYFKEKLLLDIEYQLDELRKSIQSLQPIQAQLDHVDRIEKVILGT